MAGANINRSEEPGTGRCCGDGWSATHPSPSVDGQGKATCAETTLCRPGRRGPDRPAALDPVATAARGDGGLADRWLYDLGGGGVSCRRWLSGGLYRATEYGFQTFGGIRELRRLSFQTFGGVRESCDACLSF